MLLRAEECWILEVVLLWNLWLPHMDGSMLRSVRPRPAPVTVTLVSKGQGLLRSHSRECGAAFQSWLQRVRMCFAAFSCSACLSVL